MQNPTVQKKIIDLEESLKRKVCSDLPNAFYERKKHIVSLPYKKDFDERNISTKARPTQMNVELLEYYKQEIQTLLDEKLIRTSKST